MSSRPNFFELFEFAPAYDIDLPLLAERYRELQRHYHPDRHAGKSSRDIRISVQKAALVNQAYDTLKNPVARAYYLLEMAGIETNADTYISRDGAFLMAQMQLREKLQDAEEDADPFAVLDALRAEGQEHFAALERDFRVGLDSGDWEKALEAVAKMQFFAKFQRDIEDTEARLDD